jgi:predicted oxidoreductase (fatty acid repression mutant protein)
MTAKLVKSTRVFQETKRKKSLKKSTISSILFFTFQASIGIKSVACVL